MKVLALTAMIVFFFVIDGIPQQKCKEYSNPKSVFAFCAPTGWITTPDPGEKHPQFSGKDGLAAINIQDEPVEMDLEAFSFLMIKTFLNSDGFENKRFVDISDFQTKTGVKGVRLVLLSNLQESEMKQVFYILDAPKNIKITLTATSEANVAGSDAAVDASIKSLRIKKVAAGKK